MPPPPPPPPLLPPQILPKVPKPLGSFSSSSYLPMIHDKTPIYLQKYLTEIRPSFTYVKRNVKSQSLIKQIRNYGTETRQSNVYKVIRNLSSATSFSQIPEICRSQSPMSHSKHYPPLPNLAINTREWQFITQDIKNPRQFINLDKLVILSQAYNLEMFQIFVMAKAIQYTHPELSKEFFSLLYIPVCDGIEQVRRTHEEIKLDILLLFITLRLHAYERYAGSRNFTKTPSLFNPTAKIFLDSLPFSAEWCSEMFLKRNNDPLSISKMTFSELFVNIDNRTLAVQTYFNYTEQHRTELPSEGSVKRENSVYPPLANSTLTIEKEEISCFECEYCKHIAKSEIKLSIYISKTHSFHQVSIGRIHKCAISEVDQRIKPKLRKNWYIKKDLNQHMKMIHEAPNNAITFSWQGFFETLI